MNVVVAGQRVDAHQHFWRRRRGDYTWLREGDESLAPLCRDFEPAELVPLLKTQGVVQTVLVQAAATAAETDFLLGLAEEHAFVTGVVGWVDLAAPDVAEQLARRSTHRLFKGIRPMLQDLDDPAWIARPALAEALRHAHRLRLDALVDARHLGPLAQALRRAPGLRLVVDHAAKPDLAAPGDASAWQAWAEGLRAIARLPGTVCKFSGLLTQLPAAGARDVAADVARIRPVWESLLDWFGPERLLWGSDWPVLNLRGSYPHWVAVCETLIGELTAAERSLVWADNARRFYGLEPAPAQPAQPL